MATDLALDPLTHDLSVANYDLALTTGLDAVVQKLKIRLQFFFGEWFLDNTQGVKLYDYVLVKNPNLRLVASVLKTTILETENVLSILEYNQSYDNQLRKLTVSFRVNTTFGETALLEVL